MRIQCFVRRAVLNYLFPGLCLGLASCVSQSEPSASAPPPVANSSGTYRNPIIDAPGAADPDVLQYKGKYYLYPTLDGRGYNVFVSDDLIHWERRPKCFTDARGGAWAPDLFYNENGDGAIYLYYTLSHEDGGKMIGVARATDPLGPFEDKGMLARHAIDAHLFQDTDGKLYLYYVQLNTGSTIVGLPMKDPVTPAGEPKPMLHPEPGWEKKHGSVTEGPFMLKTNGIYYLMYSGSGADGPDYAVGYATSRSPLGPFKKFSGNPIAHRGNGVLGPGHHCVVEGPHGGLWMVYHQKASTKIGWDRFLAIDPLWFDKNGVIHAKTTCGTDQPAP